MRKSSVWVVLAFLLGALLGDGPVSDAKAAAGYALLLFRMGDFYELFFEDAKTAARELGLSLTSRDKG